MAQKGTGETMGRRVVGWRGAPMFTGALRETFLHTGEPLSKTMHPTESVPQSYLFKDAGDFPNNPVFPLLFYPAAAPPDPEAIESLFHRNGWPPAWRYTVYDFPHYHSAAHEVLGIYRGTATLRLGHTTGQTFDVKPGDILVIPAGVAHENLHSTPDFHVIGAYPPHQEADMMCGHPNERPAADERIAKVALPETDPVLGKDGPLVQLWKNFRRAKIGPEAVPTLR